MSDRAKCQRLVTDCSWCQAFSGSQNMPAESHALHEHINLVGKQVCVTVAQSLLAIQPADPDIVLHQTFQIDCTK